MLWVSFVQTFDFYLNLAPHTVDYLNFEIRLKGMKKTKVDLLLNICFDKKYPFEVWHSKDDFRRSRGSDDEWHKRYKIKSYSSLKSEVAFNLENKNVNKVHIIGEGSINLFERISESFLTFDIHRSFQENGDSFFKCLWPSLL